MTPEYKLVLRLEPSRQDASDPGGVRLLRLTLKHLLRAFGWRCTSCLPAEQIQTGGNDDAK